MTLVEFLTARLDEDEVRARNLPEHLGPPPEGHPYWQDTQGRPVYEPRDRLLREIQAKREIVGLYSEVEGHESANYAAAEDYMESTVQALAAVYCDHPDYDEEWRP